MGKKRTILIADDAWENRMLLTEIFHDDFNVLEASNGATLLETFEKYKEVLSAVIVDVMLPGLTNSIIKKLNVGIENKELPVVAVASADIDDNEALSLGISGISDLISKPFSAEIILQRVLNVISRCELRDTVAVSKLPEEEDKDELNSLRKKVEIDPVTGMYNRLTFFEKTSELLKASKRKEYGLFRFDINHFKLINDIYGPGEGDRLLHFLAEYTLDFFGTQDCVCGRLEADHFAVCCPKDKINGEVLVSSYRDKLKTYKLQFDIILSFGFYLIEDKSLPINLMAERALLALRKIKGNFGVRYAFYDDSIKNGVIAEQEIAASMENAIINDEFTLYMQPQYDSESGMIVSGEALVRWNHPKKGLLLPDVFVPVFEKNGFITKLDEYVWNKTCLWLSNWLKRGGNAAPITVSINISAVDIRNDALCDILTSLIERYNIPPHMLLIEFSEAAYIECAELLAEICGKLHEKGFLILLDNFGNGYASLNSLKDIPVDALKLDMRALSDENGNVNSLVKAIISTAKWLNLPVIGVGVEKESQAEYLKMLGCTRVQGFFYSEPLPVDKFEEIMSINVSEKTDALYKKVNSSSPDDMASPDVEAALVFNSYVDAAGIFQLKDNSLELLRVNDRYYNVLGIDRAAHDIYNFRLMDLVHSSCREAFLTYLNTAVEEGTDIDYIVRFTCPVTKADDMYMKIKAKLISAVGNEFRFFAAVSNITDSVIKDEKLHCQEEKLKLLLSSMEITMLDYDIDSDILTYKLYTEGEPAVEHKFEDFKANITVNDVIHKESRKDFVKMLDAASLALTTGTMECKINVHDRGYQMKLLKYTSVANDRGIVYRIIARADDIK